MTLTEYAKRRGCSQKSVSLAVSSGRLVKSVGRNERDQPVILDPDLADREWEANTRRRADRAVVEQPRRGTPAQQSGDGNPGQPIVSAGANPAPDTNRVPPFNVSRDLRAAAAARREAAAADLAELELAAKRGRLVDADDARADVFARISMAKTRLLGIPTLVGQDAPDLAARIVPLVERRVREALEELAGADAAP